MKYRQASKPMDTVYGSKLLFMWEEEREVMERKDVTFCHVISSHFALFEIQLCQQVLVKVINYH